MIPDFESVPVRNAAVVSTLTGQADDACDQYLAKRPTACAHLATEEPSFLCASHPAAGVLCWACMERHAGRHDDDAERTCDICGTVADVICGAPVTATLRVVARVPRGSDVLIDGPVAVIGLGACRPCAEGER